MPKRERPGINPSKENAISQEELINQLQSKDSEASEITLKAPKRKIRFTMDLPEDMHQRITSRADDNGQTIKGYILKLVKADLSQYDAV